MSESGHDTRFDAWLLALAERHLADLRTQEVTRALRALSSVYVERRGVLARGGALDTAGKRAAFALFYGPLHYLVASHTIAALGAGSANCDTVYDLGCGTGAAGVAWAVALGTARVRGFDSHPWAVTEAAWTYRVMRVEGTARREDISRVRLAGNGTAIVIAFAVNELPDASRRSLLPRLIDAVSSGARALIIEPVARPTGTWWEEWANEFRRAGGREDTWRFEVDLPEQVRLFDRAAGLDHRVLTARSLYA